MPRTSDPTLKDKNGRYFSQKAAVKNYDKTVEKIILRVPEGSRAAITEYVASKAGADPNNMKYNSYNGKAYRPSVNAMIRALIEEEMGVNLDELKTPE